MPSDPTPAFLAEREQTWREQHPSYRLESYHWLRAAAWLSYAVAIVLLVVVLFPGGWNANDASWKPTRGSEMFSVSRATLYFRDARTNAIQFQLNTTYLSSPSRSYEYSRVLQIVVMLSSTCVAPEGTMHGGGSCFSNWKSSTWPFHTIPAYNGSQPSTAYLEPSTAHLDLPLDIPEIDI